MSSSSRYAKAMLLLQGKSQIKVMFTVGGFLNLNLQTGLSVSIVFSFWSLVMVAGGQWRLAFQLTRGLIIKT
nr:unnamed protein product [Callosobruchus analis]